MFFHWIFTHIHHILGYPSSMVLARYVWRERDFIERSNQMVNPVLAVETVTEGIELAEVVLPKIGQAIADIKAAIAAKKDPTAEVAALEAVVADVQNIFTAVSSLIKPPATVVVPAPAPKAA